MKIGDNWSQIGLNEFLKIPNSVVIIEWADRLGSELPKNRIDIEFQIKENDKRLIKITKL